MQWFGKSWGAPVCKSAPHVDTPIGRVCGYCRYTIDKEDSGFILPFLGAATHPNTIVYHRRCLPEVVGIEVVGDKP